MCCTQDSYCNNAPRSTEESESPSTEKGTFSSSSSDSPTDPTQQPNEAAHIHEQGSLPVAMAIPELKEDWTIVTAAYTAKGAASPTKLEPQYPPNTITSPELTGLTGLTSADTSSTTKEEEKYFTSDETESPFVTVAATKCVPDNKESARRLRGLWVSVRMCKPNKDTKFGLGFKKINGHVEITKMGEGGALFDSPLCVGDRLFHINNRRSPLTANVVKQALTNKGGWVSIVARNSNGDPNVAEATVYKASPTDKVGLLFRKEENGLLRIKKINPGMCLLGDSSVLRPGDYIESINGISAKNLDPSAAQQIIRDAQKRVSVVVNNNLAATMVSVRDLQQSMSNTNDYSKSNLNEIIVLATPKELQNCVADDLQCHEATGKRPGFFSFRLAGAARLAELGIEIHDVHGGEGINMSRPRSRSGLWSSSILRPDLRVIAINNNNCESWSKRQATAYLRSCTGNVVIVAEDTEGDSRCTYAISEKDSPRSQLGISFHKPGATLRVGAIAPNGLLSDSVVNAGDTVVAMNGELCSRCSGRGAVALAQRDPDGIGILTISNANAAVVLSNLSTHVPRKKTTQNWFSWN